MGGKREVKWRLTSSFPKSLDTHLTAVPRSSAKIVAEMTDNKFQIRCIAAGEIVPGLQVARRGAERHGRGRPHRRYYYFGKDPTFAFGTAVPFGLNSPPAERLAGITAAAIELINEFYAEYNVIGLPCGNTGARWAAGSARRSSPIDDLKGLKFRIGGFAGQVLTAWRGAAADRRRRHLSGARKGHDRRGRMGRPLRR
jgi:TRAP-type mannitol/chloroaromatic compound transport system substrate-binding protein